MDEIEVEGAPPSSAEAGTLFVATSSTEFSPWEGTYFNSKVSSGLAAATGCLALRGEGGLSL